MIDKNANEYGALIAIQDAQLAIWGRRLLPELHAEIAEYVRLYNKSAPTPNDRHNVYRGQDLVQIIIDWPSPGGGYPQRGEDLI
jgi:hypothetical protein